MTQLKIYLSFVLVTLAIFAQAQQSGIIKGRVLDADNLSMPGANVVLESMSKGAITDNFGFFTQTGIPEGAYELTVSYIGYNQDKKQVSVEAGKTTVIDFNLKAGIELSEVVVSGQLQGQSKALNTQMNKGNITNIISSDQVGRFPDANIGDALKRIPGINVQYDQGEARFGNIRGTAPQYNSVMINGDQGKLNNTFQVFDRKTLEYIGCFGGEITRNTDGIVITQKAFGDFQYGALYPVHNDGSLTAISWEDIAETLNL